MFKALFNLIFRRKPERPRFVRHLPNGVVIVANTEEELRQYEAAAESIMAKKINSGTVMPLGRGFYQPGKPSTPPRRRARNPETQREFTTSPSDLLNPANPSSPLYMGNGRIETYNHPSVHDHHHHNDGGSYDSGSSDSGSSNSSGGTGD